MGRRGNNNSTKTTLFKKDRGRGLIRGPRKRMTWRRGRDREREGRGRGLEGTGVVGVVAGVVAARFGGGGRGGEEGGEEGGGEFGEGRGGLFFVQAVDDEEEEGKGEEEGEGEEEGGGRGVGGFEDCEGIKDGAISRRIK